MATTQLLPPIVAVRIAWARTSGFSNDEHSKRSAVLAEANMKDIKDRAKGNVDEEQYVHSSIAALDASLRSLDTIYKGRQLNFEENEKLRSSYLESLKENLEFGNKAKDVLKSLPSMTVASAGGVTVAQMLSISGMTLWLVGLILASFGYWINLVIVRLVREKKQMYYVQQDYERDLYYDQYISRVATTLMALYLDIDRIHKNVFNDTYQMDKQINDIINEMLQGVRPTYCKYVHKHMRGNKITADLWSLCESGHEEGITICPHWEG
jgi:hypothetical protein